MHCMLAVLDALRTSRAREPALAAKLMSAQLSRSNVVASPGN